MNILHVIANLEPGGVQSLLARTLAAIDRTALNHHVCCVTAGGVYAGQIEALGIPVTVMRRRARLDPTVLTQMAALMRRRQIDVVHTLNFTANCWGRIAARMAGVERVIAHERGTAWTSSAAMRFVDRRLYRWTDLWLANSEASRTILTQHVGLPAAKIRMLYNGVPEPQIGADAFDLRAALQADGALIGMIGRLDTPKGHASLLSALPALWAHAPQTHAVIIGSGPLEAVLRRQAQALGIGDDPRCRFMGFRRDAVDLMAQLDLVVHPALRESFGNVLVEAAFLQRPVIAANVDGCAEVVEDGVSGLLLDGTLAPQGYRVAGASPLPALVVDGRTRALRPPRAVDPEALASAIVELLADPERRARMGAAAAERARRLFGFDRFVEALEDLYLARA